MLAYYLWKAQRLTADRNDHFKILQFRDTEGALYIPLLFELH